MNLNRKKYFLCFACVLACLVYSDKVSAQFYSVRTNLVGLGTGNLNVEGSMAFSTHWSAHLPVQYNPFRLWDDGKLKNFTVQPGVRYWMRETYRKKGECFPFAPRERARRSARLRIQTGDEPRCARPWSYSCCPVDKTADCPDRGR